MDTLTHALTGTAIYGAWTVMTDPALLHTPVAAGVLVAAILGSEAPDLDYVVKLKNGPIAYLRQHRGPSHGIPFWLIWPLVLATGIYLFVPNHFSLFFVVSGIAVLTHVFMDIFNTFGTRALWPFYKSRIALDTIFVTDFVWLLLAIIGLVGVATGWPVRRTIIDFTIAAAVYLAWRGLVSIQLRLQMRKHYPKAAWRVSVLPRPLPWWWSFVAESSEQVIVGQVTLQGQIRPEIRWRKANFTSDLARFVFEQTDLGASFRTFARHLLWTQSHDGEVIRVSMADAIYRYQKTFPFSAFVTVKQNEKGYELVEESLRGQAIDLKALFAEAADAKPGSTSEIRFPNADT